MKHFYNKLIMKYIIYKMLVNTLFAKQILHKFKVERTQRETMASFTTTF